jgi:hypothetical protein
VEEAIEPSVWFHDIFSANGQPYDAKEVAFIKRLTKDKSLAPKDLVTA